MIENSLAMHTCKTLGSMPRIGWLANCATPLRQRVLISKTIDMKFDSKVVI